MLCGFPFIFGDFFDNWGKFLQGFPNVSSKMCTKKRVKKILGVNWRIVAYSKNLKYQLFENLRANRFT